MSFDSLDNLYLTISNRGEDTYLLRLNSEGKIDSTFGDNGTFEETNFNTYQRNNYVFSLQVIDDGTIINLYDIELNLIRRFILPDIATIDNLNFNGDKLIGKTLNGIVFQYNNDGTLDGNFADNGLIDFGTLVSDQGLDGYSFTDTNGLHYFNRASLPSTFELEFVTVDKTGDNLDKIAIPYNDDTSVSDYFLSFTSQIHQSQSGDLLIEAQHLLIDFSQIVTEIIKTKRQGNIIQEFGDEGYILTPPLENTSQQAFSGFTTLIGELSSENLVFEHGINNSLAPDISTTSSTTALFVLSPQGELHPDFGTDGFFDLTVTPAPSRYITIKDPKRDHIYISSSINPTSSILHITKLNLEDLPGTPIVTDTKNVQPENQSISLSPNPTANATNLLYTGPSLSTARLHVLDTYGQIVKEIKLSQLSNNASVEIITSDIYSGIYLVRLSDGEQNLSTQKLVIAH